MEERKGPCHGLVKEIDELMSVLGVERVEMLIEQLTE